MRTTIWQRGRLIWSNPHWRRVVVSLMLLVSLGVVLWTIARDWYNLITYDWHFEWMYLALSSGTYIGSLVLAVIAWSMVMHALDAPLEWKQHGRFFLYSWIARRLPTAAPFVASRVLLYEQAGVARRLTLMGMLWEHILLIASGGVLVVLLFPFTPLLGENIPLLPVACIAVMSVVLAARPQLLVMLLNRILRRWKQQTISDFLGAAATLGVFVLHVGVWLTGGLILFLLVRSVYMIEWTALPVLLQIWVTSGLVGYLSFLIPVGLNLRDVSMVVLLTLIVPLSVAVIIALLVRLWITINELFWVLVFSRL
jgi:hypothetical protein